MQNAVPMLQQFSPSVCPSFCLSCCHNASDNAFHEKNISWKKHTSYTKFQFSTLDLLDYSKQNLQTNSSVDFMIFNV